MIYTQIRVIASIEREISTKMLRNLSEFNLEQGGLFWFFWDSVARVTIAWQKLVIIACAKMTQVTLRRNEKHFSTWKRLVKGIFMIREWPIFFLVKCEMACFFSWIMISLEAANHDFLK